MAVSTIRRPQSDDDQSGAVKLSTIDTDIHHGIRGAKDLIPYLSRTDADRYESYGVGGGGNLYAYNGGVRGYRADVVDGQSPGGLGAAATNIEMTISDLMDGCAVDIGLLTGSSMYSAASIPDVDYASALCRAFNDFTIEHWLQRDSRFRFAMAICPQDPAQAAAEIDRIGSHPQVISVILPCGAPRAFGQRFYHPIFEACERNNLTVSLHFATEGSGINPPPTSAGYPTYYAESRQSRPAFYQVHLASMIFEGWFERFPTLKVAMLEGGFAWVPSYVWKLDQDWKALRWQTPWVKQLPSETVFSRVRFATQPLEEPNPPSAIHPMIEWMQGQNTLMFASDYPHWDWDDPRDTLTQLDPALRHRIFVENALDCYPKLRNGQ
ncbi:MAG: amidohydrolase [Chloroflexi bacterium]|nr:amidohydrolase [Chloroflexota bacterium]